MRLETFEINPIAFDEWEFDTDDSEEEFIDAAKRVESVLAEAIGEIAHKRSYESARIGAAQAIEGVRWKLERDGLAFDGDVLGVPIFDFYVVRYPFVPLIVKFVSHVISEAEYVTGGDEAKKKVAAILREQAEKLDPT